MLTLFRLVGKEYPNNRWMIAFFESIGSPTKRIGQKLAPSAA